MLLRICLYLFLLFLPANYTTTRSSSPLIPADPAAAMSSVCRQLYADMQLDSMVDYTAFEQAITGAQAIERRNKDKTAEEITPLLSPTKSILTKVHWDFSLRKIPIRAKMAIP